MNTSPPSLDQIADKIMQERGFFTDFPPEVRSQIDKLPQATQATLSSKDLSLLPWVSIDNDDTKDIDQLTYAEAFSEGQDRIFIAIADVNGLIQKNSPIDIYAAHNTTSVYTPSKIYPMLPQELSTDLTSLNANVTRSAIVVELLVSKEGDFTLSDVSIATVKNHAKLAYNNVSAWLENKSSLPPQHAQPEISQQLILQDQIARRIQKYRESQGALSFKTSEVKPVVKEGIPQELEEVDINRARLLIENFMIAANVAMTTYMTQQKLPVLRRIVRTPKRWERIVSLAKEYNYTLPELPDAKALQDFLSVRRAADPLKFADLSLAIIKLIGRGEYVVAMPNQPSAGHFDLALSIYSHTTAPNRRYPDLLMQRILKNYLGGLSLAYTENELTALASRCSEKERDATKVERRVLKSAAAMVLEHQIGHAFPAMVTGVNENGTWIRLLTPPIEGKLVRGTPELDVGDHIKVKLVHVDIANGYLDFIPLK